MTTKTCLCIIKYASCTEKVMRYANQQINVYIKTYQYFTQFNTRLFNPLATKTFFLLFFVIILLLLCF